VLLTITTTRAPATDLGYLLHKHPDRVQAFATAADTAHVFYPEATPQRCTAALLLEVDPVALVRGPIGKNAPNTDGELAQYVNDRPYAASSMLAVALKGAFRTALTGRCDARPDLAAERIPLSIRVPALRCRGGSELATRVFEPLGWTVQTTTQDLQPPDGDRPGPAGEAVRGANAGRPGRERYQGRASGRVRGFCLYGQTTGETDEYGLPVRYPWAQEYRGRALVLYGHTPVPETEWVNNTMCLDTGCVFGGRLTAFNYPERTVVSVQAARVYYAPAKPFPAEPPSGHPQAHREPDVLDIRDVSGSRVLQTAYLPRMAVREDHAAAALEVMSRFAIDPRWLLYLPPTMSPPAAAAAQASPAAAAAQAGTATSRREDLLEHPEQAFEAAEQAGLFDELGTSWLLLDAELLPWSVKAGQLLRDQYAAVCAAAAMSLPAANASSPSRPWSPSPSTPACETRHQPATLPN
jgi:hypothetical protein